jgi:hypothetical protein
MKFITTLIFVTFSIVSFAQTKSMVGENANPEFSNCLKEDRCPSQTCKNSCAMMNSQQTRHDVDRSASGPKRNKKGTSTAQ